MALRVEFDPSNKILLLRFDGALTDESIEDFYRVIRQHWTAADARMGIVDFSTVTDFALSSNLLRQLAKQEPCVPDPTGRPRVIVAPQTHVFGLARMFQIWERLRGRCCTLCTPSTRRSQNWGFSPRASNY
jgi:hypothetical protein